MSNAEPAPRKAVYGLLGIYSTYALFAVYLVWLLLPERVIHSSVSWLPDQYVIKRV